MPNRLTLALAACRLAAEEELIGMHDIARFSDSQFRSVDSSVSLLGNVHLHWSQLFKYRTAGNPAGSEKLFASTAIDSYLFRHVLYICVCVAGLYMCAVDVCTHISTRVRRRGRRTEEKRGMRQREERRVGGEGGREKWRKRSRALPRYAVPNE